MNKILGLIDKHRETTYLISAIVIGSIVALVLNLNSANNLSPQDSLSILMSQDIASGDLMLLRYGQPFMGSIEQYLGALVALIFPYSSWVVFAPRLVLFLATAFVLWRFFNRTNHRLEMKLVGSLLWLSVLLGLFYETALFGSSMSALFLNTLSLVLAYYAAHSLRNSRFFIGWAFVSGLALWASIFSLIFIVPSAIWILYSARALSKKIFPAIVFFIFGSLPWWIFNITNSFDSLRSLRSNKAQPIPVIDKHEDFDLFRITGLSPSLSDRWESNYLAIILIAIVSLSVLYAILMLVLGVSSILDQRRQYSNFTYLVLAILGLSVIVEIAFVVVTGESQMLRFVSLIVVALFVMVIKKSWLQLSILFIAVLFVSIGYFVNANTLKTVEKQTTKSVIEELKNSEVDTAIAPYNFAHRLEIKSQGKITFAPFDAGLYDQNRYENANENLDAILVRSQSRQDQFFVLCIQGVFGEGFERIEMDELFIYLVPEIYRDEIGTTTAGCRAATFNSKN